MPDPKFNQCFHCPSVDNATVPVVGVTQTGEVWIGTLEHSGPQSPLQDAQIKWYQVEAEFFSLSDQP